MSTHITYRPEIDGLRAFAVLAVIFYHANLGLPGGFVGVDVFFVISGYLITSLIAKDLRRQQFSLTHFWERRIRRIWPAAMTTVLGVLLAGFVLMFPRAYEYLATDAIYQIFMLANVHFWRTTNYFDIGAELRPLLHMWSLAVEEQSYIIFPPILMLLWRWTPRRALQAVIAGGVLSFVISIWAVNQHPQAAFYLLPARAWELMCGAALALWRPQPVYDARVYGALGWLGAGLALAPVVLYDRTTAFPGFAALPPCIGTMLLIYATERRTLWLTKLLAWEPLRVIGLMSYSLYLWHWPILVYVHYVLGRHTTLGVKSVALGSTILLSYLSWRIVELPVRRIGGRTGLRYVAAAAAASSAALLSIAFVIRINDGMPGRFDPATLAYGASDAVNKSWRSPASTNVSARQVTTAIGADADGDSQVDWVLWGDSHGMALSEFLDSVAKEQGMIGAAALRDGTAPVIGVWRPAEGPEGQSKAAWNQRVLKWIEQHHPKNVVLCARWAVYLDGRPDGHRDTLLAPVGTDHTNRDLAYDAMTDGLRQTVQACTKAGAKVWFLRDVPCQLDSPEQRAIRARFTRHKPDDRGIDKEVHRHQQKSVENLLKDLEDVPMHVIDISSECFDDTDRSIIAVGGVSLYADDDHINTIGARALLGDVLRSLITRMLATRTTGDGEAEH